jgi:hypothetical protein
MVHTQLEIPYNMVNNKSVFRRNTIGGLRKKRTPFLLLQHAWPPTLLTPVTLSERIQHCRSIVLSQLQIGPPKQPKNQSFVLPAYQRTW